MALIVTDPDAPDFVRRYVNLADARLGAVALDCSDDFFADRQRMLNPEPAVFVPGKYDANGKWMDGWESRRKRGPGHDWCVVRLARPARLLGVDLDTSHFTGNFPPAASLEACRLDAGDPDAGTVWEPLLPAQNLGGNRHHYVALDGTRMVSHVRVNLFPDGGLARLRLYGVPAFDAAATDTEGLVDLVAGVVADMEASGDPIPEPITERRFSGKFNVRVPESLHRELALSAAQEGVSLNRLVSDRLARS